MMPDGTPPRPDHVNTTCTDCGGQIDGNHWRCPACVAAAQRAIAAAAPGQVVRPSDVARERKNA